jgi:hypothetical protein
MLSSNHSIKECNEEITDTNCNEQKYASQSMSVPPPCVRIKKIAMCISLREPVYVSPPAVLRSRKSQCANHCCARHYAPTTTVRTHSQARLQGKRDEHYTTLVAKAPVWSGCRLERVTRKVPGVTYSSPSTTSNTCDDSNRRYR